VKEQIFTLVRLQKIDTEESALLRELEMTAKRLATLNKNKQDIAAQMEAVREKRQLLESRQRELETEAQETSVLVKKSQGRLMHIKNNREYRALLKGVEDGKRTATELEDQAVACMVEIEELDKRLAALDAEYKDLESRFLEEKEAAELQEKAQGLRLEEFTEARKGLHDSVQPSLLARYQLIRQRGGGLAVVPVKQAVCRGCNMNIPPQAFNELQRGDELRFCPHCERIIYWEKAD